MFVMKRRFYMCAFSSAMFLFLTANAVRADDGLSAQEIINRWTAVSGLTAQNSQTSVTHYEVTRAGRTLYETVVAKAPNKVLVRMDYTWRHFVEEERYDGVNAWTADGFGAGGPADVERSARIIADAARYNDAMMFSGRMNVKLERLPDDTLQGTSYYSVQMTADGGMPTKLFFDKQTYWLMGYSFEPKSYNLCVEPLRDVTKHIICKTAVVNEDGKIYAIVRRVDGHNGGAVDDEEFMAPKIAPNDSETDALVQRYAAALGTTTLTSAHSLLGDGRFTNDAFRGRFAAFAWKLRVYPPLKYELETVSGAGHVSKAGYDGLKGFIQPYGAPAADATEINSLSSMILNNCAARPSDCNVTVGRLPDAELDGKVWNVIGFWNKADLSRYGVMFLDPTSALPYAAYSQESILYFRQWAQRPDGLRYPTDIDLQQLWTDMHVTNIVAGPPDAP